MPWSKLTTPNDEVSGEARQFAPIRLTAGLG